MKVFLCDLVKEANKILFAYANEFIVLNEFKSSVFIYLSGIINLLHSKLLHHLWLRAMFSWSVIYYILMSTCGVTKMKLLHFYTLRLWLSSYKAHDSCHFGTFLTAFFLKVVSLVKVCLSTNACYHFATS